MPIARGLEQFKASVDAEAPPVVTPVDGADVLTTEIAALRETIAALRADNERQAAQLDELAGPVEWLALKACDRGGYTCETLRTWCITGVVASRREKGGRLFVNTRSLAAHLARLGLAKAIRSA
jgi:hypothetical protein